MARPPLTVTRSELLTDGSDGEFRELVHALLAFQVRHEAIRDGHGAYIGLPGPQYTMLIATHHLETQGDVTPRALAEHLHVSNPFITMETNKLLRAGLIVKTRDPLDARRIVLSTTALARRKLAALAPVQRKLNDLEFAQLSRADFKQLLRMVNALISNCDTVLAMQPELEPMEDHQNERAA